MLDKTQQHSDTETVEKALGLGVQFTVTVGQGRQIAMTAGVPLDWTGEEINNLLDKLAAGLDRQAMRYQLHDMRLQLAQAEQQLLTNRQQLVNYERANLEAWERDTRRSGRAFKPSENQEKQAQNFKNTDQHLAVQIERLRKDIKDVEEKCR